MNYLNEWSPFAAQWCRNLAEAGEIPDCVVDETDIRLVTGDRLSEYKQCHFFAGIAGWPLALKLAGVPADFPVWTGSCPCQPFSAIGKRKGKSDERHLWPEFRRLYRLGRPAFMFGEQVAGKDGIGWLESVQADLQADGYAVVSAELCSPLVSKDHDRARIYWGAWDTVDFRPVQFAGDCDDDGNCPVCGIDYAECECPRPTEDGVVYTETESGLFGLRLADAYLPRQSADRGAILKNQWNDIGRGGVRGCRLADSTASRQPPSRCWPQGERDRANRVQKREHSFGESANSGGLVYHNSTGPQGYAGDGYLYGAGGRNDKVAIGPVAQSGGDVCFVECENGKWRRFQPGSFPMAHGLPRGMGRGKSTLDALVRDTRKNRVGRIEGYGNAIVPELAALFITEFFGAIWDLAG